VNYGEPIIVLVAAPLVALVLLLVVLL
jgi:hypothetical protein